MRKNILTLIAMIFLLLLSSCGRDCQQEETVEPKDLVINVPEPCEYGSVYVYDEHVEEFSYTGKVEIVNDGKNGKPIKIVVDVQGEDD